MKLFRTFGNTTTKALGLMDLTIDSASNIVNGTAQLTEIYERECITANKGHAYEKAAELKALI